MILTSKKQSLLNETNDQKGGNEIDRMLRKIKIHSLDTDEQFTCTETL